MLIVSPKASKLLPSVLSMSWLIKLYYLYYLWSEDISIFYKIQILPDLCNKSYLLRIAKRVIIVEIKTRNTKTRDAAQAIDIWFSKGEVAY